MSYVDRHLLPDERVVYCTRLHWILLTRPVLVTVVGLVLAALPWWYGLQPMFAVVGLAIALASVVYVASGILLLIGIVFFVDKDMEAIA